MSIWKCFQMAMSSIVGNKMRSILTMLGIIIGITAVIALVSLMSGMTSEITETFINSITELEIDYDMNSFEDIMNRK